MAEPERIFKPISTALNMQTLAKPSRSNLNPMISLKLYKQNFD
ncbi:hypothetical protein HMPREF9370_1232 [Neisseria wadsworthii 9715]|uniref:Uncharacterized protein n=1 Tax=Neisseria wadsworthii 9715 TaxID=1030841 RepID=G4CQ72_9NEIS|nr:hypothetical protein HMPREF9370_1232 [Neisseria wadsworthii 9715]